MAAGPHTFMCGSVFSPERFQGCPIAIVSVRANALSAHRKALIAKEFNHPETAFLHDAPSPSLPRRVEIFDNRGHELPLSGDAITATAHFVFTYCDRLKYGGPQDRDTQKQHSVLMTKAGPVTIYFNPYRQIAASALPHTMHVHNKEVLLEKIMAVQPMLKIVPTIDKLEGRGFPVVSFRKGIAIVLVDVTEAPEVLGSLQDGKTPDTELDKEWTPSLTGCLYYRKLVIDEADDPPIQNIQARYFCHGREQQAVGIAACALACYLAVQPDPATTPTKLQDVDDLAKKTQTATLAEKPVRKVFGVKTGVEVGRQCTLAIELEIKTEHGKSTVSSVMLSGRSNFGMKGELYPP